MDDAFLSFKPTEKLAEVDHSFKKLDNDLNQFKANPIFNIKRARKIVKRAKDLETRARKIEGKGFESVLLTNITSRVRAIRQLIETKLEGNYDYLTILRDIYGVTKEDVEEIKQDVQSLGIQNLSDRLSEPRFNVRNAKPRNLKEKKGVKNFFKTACKTIFERAPNYLAKDFDSLDKYMKTVAISETRNSSYHEAGKICLSVKNVPIAKLIKGDEVRECINVVRGMRTVGEEGLLGHQGQYLLTQRYDLPYSLKVARRHTSLANEIVGKFGRSRSLTLLDKNRKPFQEFTPEDILDHLRKNSKLNEKTKYFFHKFRRLFSDYLYLVKGREIEDIMDFLENLTGWKYHTSNRFKKILEERYRSGFWNNFWKNIKEWIYIVAYKRHKEIERKLDRIDENKAKKIRNYLRVGEWTRKGFEAYLDFLLEHLD